MQEGVKWSAVAPMPATPPALPSSAGPLLCTNSVALKWSTPVGAMTRAEAAGCLWALAEAPEGCAAISARLAAPRLAALAVGALAGGGSGSAAGGAAGPSGLGTPRGRTHMAVAAPGAACCDDRGRFFIKMEMRPWRLF
jgi:hypothetical protein